MADVTKNQDTQTPAVAEAAGVSPIRVLELRIATDLQRFATLSTVHKTTERMIRRMREVMGREADKTLETVISRMGISLEALPFPKEVVQGLLAQIVSISTEVNLERWDQEVVTVKQEASKVEGGMIARQEQLEEMQKQAAS